MNLKEKIRRYTNYMVQNKLFEAYEIAGLAMPDDIFYQMDDFDIIRYELEKYYTLFPDKISKNFTDIESENYQ
mgnify:CR=1 FL=1